MTLTIVIPAWNEEKYIERCLTSIFAQTELPDEVIVVDNNCIDHTIEIAQRFPVRIVKEAKQGMIQARDAGFNAVTSEIIARTDADTVVPKDWTKRIKKHFEKDAELLGLSGPAIFFMRDNMKPLTVLQTQLFFKSYNHSLRLNIGHDGLIGSNMSLRKSGWEKIKDEVCLEDKKVHEDIDLSIHLGRYGKILFDDKLIVNSSFRRWKNLKSYLEYPHRYIKTVQYHAMKPAPLSRENLQKLWDRFSLKGD